MNMKMTRRSYDQEKLITKAFSVNHNDRQSITITLRLITNQSKCTKLKSTLKIQIINNRT